jgi:hypothetical protein
MIMRLTTLGLMLINSFSSAALDFASLKLVNHYTVSSNLKLFWKFDSSQITFAFEAKSNGNWVGIGFAEPTSGSMPGADILSFEVSDGKVTMKDRWASAKSTPEIDLCQSSTLLQSYVNSTTLQAVFTRSLDSADLQDRVLNTNAGVFTRMIWAFGSTPQFSAHNALNRGAFGVYLNGTAPIANPNWNVLSLNFQNYLVPAEDTHYGCISFDVPSDKNYYIKRFEFNNSKTMPVSEPHHMLVYACNDLGSNAEFNFYKNSASGCFQQEQTCTELLWVWALGVDSYNLPDQVSFPMGLNGAKGILLQMHYSNPTSAQGQYDNSGVNVFYDTVATQYLGGVLQVGDAQLDSSPLPARQSQIHMEYSCPSACTSQMSQKITIFGDFLHAHGQGSMLYSTITDSNGKTRTLNRIEYYDNMFEQITPVSDSLSPGESLNTHCVYQTADRSSDVEFGLATSDEMCLEFVFYYPRFDNAYCIYHANDGVNGTACFGSGDAASNPSRRDSTSLLAKGFGTQPSQCQPAPPNLSSPNSAFFYHQNAWFALVNAILLAILFAY